MVLAIMLMSGAIVFAIIAQDWFGLANALAMAFSILVRAAIIASNRASLNFALEKVFSEKWAWNMKTMLIVTPDGKAITLFAPLGLVTEGILTTPRILNPLTYRLWRYIGWFYFGVHIISLGMSSLASQIIAACLLIVGTLIVTRSIACEENQIGSQIRIREFNDSGDLDRRTDAYVRLELIPEEEQTMTNWGIMPQRANTAWWMTYQSRKKTKDKTKFLAWKQKCLASTRHLVSG